VNARCGGDVVVIVVFDIDIVVVAVTGAVFGLESIMITYLKSNIEVS
jgi:hypothetical protein